MIQQKENIGVQYIVSVGKSNVSFKSNASHNQHNNLHTVRYVLFQQTVGNFRIYISRFPWDY